MDRGKNSDGFRSIEIESRYRSDSKRVVADFYIPLLCNAVSYSRAVGYFTSASLQLLASGIDSIVGGGGRIRIIASPHLSPDDVEDITRGYDRRLVIERSLQREMTNELSSDLLDGLSVIGTLIAQKRLDLKLAFVDGQFPIGLYHEKIGIVRDRFGDLVAFTGSSNETIGGLVNNFESVEVYRGWIPGDGTRALRLEADFDGLWNNETENLTVVDFPAVAKERLVEIARERGVSALIAGTTAEVTDPDGSAGTLRPPASLQPRQYQKDAMVAWLRQRGRGTLKMATGTGKTKTALFAAAQVANVENQKERPLVLLIVAPLQALVDQWIDDVQLFGVDAVGVYESSNTWLPVVERRLASARLGRRQVVVLVATNASFSGAKFQSILSRIDIPLMLVADEAHNLGSATYRKLLPENAAYRLALSATPERWFDDEGTEGLLDYFGPVAYELGIEKAIYELKALCPYVYHPRLVELRPEEYSFYAEITTKIGRMLRAGQSTDSVDTSSPLGALLRKRSAVLGHALGKIEALHQDVDDMRNEWFQLIYCAEGSSPRDMDDDEGTGQRQISEVMSMVGGEMGLHAHTYTSETPRRLRAELIERFSGGDDLRVLVAMRCLDEGVDIPDAKIGYLLASSTNPRQFIQRRGRLLRRAEGKTRATIYDYIATPPAGTPIDFTVERNLMVRELARVNEFAKISENYHETLEVLRPIKMQYRLMDL
ncbi:DEAD/DEAH box helicase family protein [Rhodococcus cerastii]|uniref:DEAD/DEAH box helicase family protein n=1 Tax=Rhodococcus cerastii TaxID=908616 RepID=A0ABU4D413_9NOCA|nr:MULTISPECIES: DEAD/DEAH box helicase family protein [Rhodococcus]MDV6304469.1 DEAD/DEAH box helicase family protein [Rhodococcus cerastii]MDV8057906.1 DEAD/DEAH box helicase family protein [Rhodococcus sp. IEGM 1343]